MHHETAVDYSEILRESFEEPMNNKGSGWGPSMASALIVVVVTSALNHVWDGSNDRDKTLTEAVKSIGQLETKVSDLSEQVKRLTEQPYVRRDELESRLSGFDQRISDVERGQQSGRRR